jgi:hypothetical protein
MGFDPEITFHVAGHPRPVTPESRLWGLPLAGKTGHENRAAEWTVGDYLAAAGAFLIRDQGQMIRRAVEALSETHGLIRAVAVCLEKHGAFYHPLKITVAAGSESVTLVLNGAVRDPGFTLIQTEYRLLGRLAGQVVPGFIPRVFGTGTLPTEKGVVGFFLGQWFEGFHEFHVTQTARGDRVAIWKDDGIHEPVPWHRAVRIYENIAYVLTAYYGLDTGHEIFPWHHAAGDFVTDSRGDVRLITVRGIGLLAEPPSHLTDPEVRQLFCLLFYFLNLTLCIRLDRLDGTGPVVWLPDMVLNASVKGVCRSLADRSARKTGVQSSSRLPARFLEFLKTIGPDQLYDIMSHLLEDRHFSPAEAQLAGIHMAAHVREIIRVLARM